MAIRRDILLDADGDIDLSGGGSWVADEAAIAQEIRVRLRTFLGEYFLDTVTRGLPYERWVSGGWSSAVQKEAQVLVRSELLSVPGVTRILDPGVSIDWDSAARSVTVSASVAVDSGAILEVLQEVTP